MNILLRAILPLVLLSLGVTYANATLILTAICSDGVFIRSDKRLTIVHSDRSPEYKDNYNKVFITDDKQIIVFNIGFASMNGHFSCDLAINLANRLQQVADPKVSTVLDLTAESLDKDITTELAENPLAVFCCFVVIIKLSDGRYHFCEVDWRKGNQKKYELEGFMWGGSGSKYVMMSTDQKSADHWSRLSLAQAKREVEIIFDAALQRETEAKGMEFSAAYDDLAVSYSGQEGQSTPDKK